VKTLPAAASLKGDIDTMFWVDLPAFPPLISGGLIEGGWIISMILPMNTISAADQRRPH
jgi:hypothetical protein